MANIFLHGLGQSGESWHETLKHLPKDYAACPELKELLCGKAATYPNLFHGLETYCAQYNKPVNLCGLSIGAVLALDYAIHHPDRVGSLVLIACQYKSPTALIKLQNAVFRVLPHSAFENMGYSKGEIIQLTASMSELDFSAQLMRVDCPVSILCGENDMVNKRVSTKLAALLSNAALQIVPDAGHEMNTDAPDKLAAIIIKLFNA